MCQLCERDSIFVPALDSFGALFWPLTKYYKITNSWTTIVWQDLLTKHSPSCHLFVPITFFDAHFRPFTVHQRIHSIQDRKCKFNHPEEKDFSSYKFLLTNVKTEFKFQKSSGYLALVVHSSCLPPYLQASKQYYIACPVSCKKYFSTC